MKDELVIKQLDKKSLPLVIQLAKVAHGAHYTLDYLEHKYNSGAYCDEEYLCCIGFLNDTAVAFYGGIPLVFRNEKTAEEVLIVQACDSYTLPQYQGKGFHTKLALASYELMRSKGVKAVFAFMSENTIRSCKKLNWTFEERFKLFQFEVKSGIPWLKIYDRLRWTRNYSLKRTEKIISSHFGSNKQSQNFQQKNHFGVIYSKDYINYKNKYHCRIIEVFDCKIWLKINSVIYVGGFDGLTDENVKNVLLTIEILAKKLGTNKVIIEVDKRNEQFSILSKELSYEDGFKIGHLCFDQGFDFSILDVNFSDLDSFL